MMSEPSPSKIRAWLQLMRIANLPTAISNIAAGYVLAGETSDDTAQTITDLVILMLFSALMYCGGMILNDAFDAEVDATNRPGRPIPSGRISRRSAFTVGGTMLAIPNIFSVVSFALWTWPKPEWSVTEISFQMALICGCLAITITLYNGWLKKTLLASPLMGGCRTLNILLGGVTGWIFAQNVNGWWLNERLISFATFIGIFVMGITLLARTETKHQQSRMKLLWAAAVMISGLLLVATLPLLADRLSSKPSWTTDEVSRAYIVFVAIISAPIIRRLWFAVRDASAASVGAAIVTSLSSLIFLDAAVCFLERPDKPAYAGSVALLIVPVMILRRFSAQT